MGYNLLILRVVVYYPQPLDVVEKVILRKGLLGSRERWDSGEVAIMKGSVLPQELYSRTHFFLFLFFIWEGLDVGCSTSSFPSLPAWHGHHRPDRNSWFSSMGELLPLFQDPCRGNCIWGRGTRKASLKVDLLTIGSSSMGLELRIPS